MTKRLCRNLDFLKLLGGKNKSVRKKVLSDAKTDLLKCISDCCHNILNGNIEMTRKEIKSLKKYRQVIREVANKRIALRRKRKILLQHGGALPGLLIPILTIAGSLLEDLIAK